MENEVFKTNQTSEVGINVESSSSQAIRKENGEILTHNINDRFISVPPERLSKYISELGDVDKKLKLINKNLKKIPNIIRLNNKEINLKFEKNNNATKQTEDTRISFSERLARISKTTKSINLDLDLNWFDIH